ncbi:hypothetical protein RD792_018108, partial [Penstemon davidsonii]
MASSDRLKSEALMEQMKLHMSTDAGKKLVEKIGLVYQINIAPKKIGFNDKSFVVDLKKGEVKEDKELASARQGVYTFRAQGMVYHDLPGLVPNENGPEYFQLYFVDSEEEVESRMKILENASLSENTVKKLIKILEVNPYARVFRQLRDYPSMDDVQVRIKKDVTLDQRVYNSPTADQVAAVWVEGNNANIPFDRDIVVHAHSENALNSSAIPSADDILSREQQEEKITIMNDSINSLELNQKTWTVRLKILRIGTETRCGANLSTRVKKMIMMDDEGTRIGIVIFNDDIQQFDKIFKLQKTYIITNGHVQKSNPMYFNAHPEIELVLKKYSKVVEASEPISANVDYEFIDFESINPDI